MTALVLMGKADAQRQTVLIREKLGASFAAFSESLVEAAAMLQPIEVAEGWRAMGYTSMARYVMAEFSTSRSNAYRLIDQMQAAMQMIETNPKPARLPSQRKSQAAIRPPDEGVSRSGTLGVDSSIERVPAPQGAFSAGFDATIDSTFADDDDGENGPSEQARGQRDAYGAWVASPLSPIIALATAIADLDNGMGVLTVSDAEWDEHRSTLEFACNRLAVLIVERSPNWTTTPVRDRVVVG